ncbi:hypothetical protein ACFL35_03610 [Candidatus Riflebacteria bacterium]
MSRENNEDVWEFLEPATVFTLTASGMYLAGRSYADSFYGRFGIDHNSFDFPTVFYLVNGFFPLLFCVLLLVVALFLAKDQPDTYYGAFKGNFLAIIVAVSLVFIGIQEYRGQEYLSKGINIFILFMAFWLILLSVIITLKKKSLGKYLWEMNLIQRFVGFIFLLLFCNIIANCTGSAKAENLINGRDDFVRYIKFKFKTDSPAFAAIEKKQFILIIHRNEKYYVTEPLKKRVINPRILIIPEGAESEIAYAETFFKKRVSEQK